MHARICSLGLLQDALASQSDTSQNNKRKCTFSIVCISAAESFALVADMNRILKVRLGGSKGRQVHTLVTGPSYFASFSALAHDETKNVLYFTDVNR